MPKPLEGKVALVAGATRGAGRGVARELASAGAYVYCTGRSTRAAGATPGRPETIDETAEIIRAEGGLAVAVRCDHTHDSDVAGIFAQIEADQGRLDILVNDVWGGDSLIDWSAAFWQVEPESARTLFERSLLSHLLTAQRAAPMMIRQGRGLIVEVGDGDSAGYRGQLLYDFVKAGVIRLAYAMAWDLRGTGVTSLAISPGFLRSEAMLDQFGVTESTWREGIARDPFFAESETPQFVGRAIAALAADPEVARKAGGSYFAADLAREYGFTDVDGRTPDFWARVDAWLDREFAKAPPLAQGARDLALHRYRRLHLTPRSAERAAKLARQLMLDDLGEGQRLLLGT